MYSICFRKQVLVIKEKEKLTIRQVAKRFGISVRSVVNWLQRLEPKTKRNKPATKIDMQTLKEDVDTHPDAYLYERALRLKASISGIYSALKRLDITYKKNAQSSQSGSRKAFYILPKNKNLCRQW